MDLGAYLVSSSSSNAYYCMDIRSMLNYKLEDAKVPNNIYDGQVYNERFGGTARGYTIKYSSIMTEYFVFMPMARQLDESSYITSSINNTLSFVAQKGIPVALWFFKPESGSVIIDGTEMYAYNVSNLPFKAKVFNSTGIQHVDLSLTSGFDVEVIDPPACSIVVNFINRYGIPMNWAFSEKRKESY